MAPRLTGAEDGVERDDDLSHHGGDDELSWLASLPKLFGEDPHDGVVTHGDDRRHVERLSDDGSSGLDVARPFVLAAVVIDWRKAHQEGGCAFAESPSSGR